MSNFNESQLHEEFDDIESKILELKSQQSVLEAQIKGLTLPRWALVAIATARGKTVLQESGDIERLHAAETSKKRA